MLGYDSDSQQMKNYRVDKMKHIKLLKDKREGQKAYSEVDLSTYTTENFSMFQGVKETVNLVADEELAGVIIDRFGKDVWMHRMEDGRLSVTVDVAVSDQFYGWVTSMGGKVRIVSPGRVAADYLALLKKCMGADV